MAVSNAGAKVNDYVKKNFPDSKADLFAVFIERCGQMAKKNGYQAMITQHAWMFLSSFEKLRTKLLAVDIVNMAHLGARAFEEIGGEVVQTTSFVIRKSHIADYKGEYCRLIEPTSQQGKEDMFLSGENRYAADQSNFSKIPGSPVAYWVSKKVIASFTERSVGDCGTFSYGVFTCNNARFLRLWFECQRSDISLSPSDNTSETVWRLLNKGGTGRKWYGNLEYVIFYGQRGDAIRAYRKQNGQSESLPGETLYFNPHISWSLVTSGNLTFRYYPSNMVFDISAPSMFNENTNTLLSTLAILNSKIGNFYLPLFNPTMNNTNSDIKRIPFMLSDAEQKQIHGVVEDNICKAKIDWDSYETSWDFKRNACRSCGQEELGQHCLELALKNPCLEENWEKRLRRVFTAVPFSGRSKPRSDTAKPVTDTKPDDGTVYHYCSVQVQRTRRPYAYLTGGLPLKVGDWVELPFGKDDVLRQGQVKAVMDCTRMVAPWPPEQTKTVIRTIDAPAVTPIIEAAAPKPHKRVEQPKKETEKVEVPVIPAPETKTEEPKAEPQVTEPVVSEKDEKKPVPPKKSFPLGKLIAAVLAVAVIAGISISVSSRNKQRAATYDAALQEMSNGNYTSAEQDFSELSGYRDAASLSVYCKYADMYKDRTDYAGGQDELSNITLQYDTGWQQDVDALETRVKGYKAEKDAAEEAERQRIAAENAAKQEQSRKDQYSGKLPVDGMPVSCLKYTSIGSPTKTEKCQFYDNMDVHRRYKILHWYNSEGQTVAYCHSHQPKGETEEVIYAFTYYETPIGRPNSAPPWTPPSTSGGNNSGSIRDDYDNPEDLWEDNQDWYEDEDEAWDEWYDD